MKILIVEDEAGLLDSIKGYLMHEGIICETASDYQTAYQKISIYKYDCILLDLMLPDGEGLQLLKHLKALKKTDGVIIISARNALEDRLTGLNLGADDYLIKPFHLSELNARIAAVIRRKNAQTDNLITFNEVTIDVDAKNVAINNVDIKFTRKEFELLLYLMVNKGKVVSKNAAAEHLWGDDADMADKFDFIYTHIKNIRKKMHEGGCKDYLQSVYGIGYKFAAQ